MSGVFDEACKHTPGDLGPHHPEAADLDLSQGALIRLAAAGDVPHAKSTLWNPHQLEQERGADNVGVQLSILRPGSGVAIGTTVGVRQQDSAQDG
jgi:hypothetical protein